MGGGRSTASLSRKIAFIPKRVLLIMILGSVWILDQLWYSINLLQLFNEDLEVSGPVPSHRIYRHYNSGLEGDNLCVLVRTYVGHSRASALQALLLNFAAIADDHNFRPGDAIQRVSLYVANTHHEPKRSDDTEIVQAMERTIGAFDKIHSRIDLHFIALPDGMVPSQSNYGYDATNFMLDQILLKDASDDRCDRILNTNGDNLYNHGMLQRVNNWIRQRNDLDDMVSFQFVTHHERDGNVNTVLPGKFFHGLVDLGAVVIKRRVFDDICGKTLRYEGDFSGDWHLFKDAMKCNASSSTIPEVLFFHQ